MSFILTNTNKGVLCIVHNHFKQCTLTIHTNSKISNILTENENIFHNHNIVENRDIQRQIVRNNCKQKATECISERPNKIIRRELMAVETTELLHDDMS
ncbi:Uncharacterized protein FWK35_00037807, partial [Aphis craccivora]